MAFNLELRSPDNKTPPRPGEGATGLRTGLEVLRTPTRSIFDILAAVESTQKSLPGIKIGQSPPKPCTEAAWCGLGIRTTRPSWLLPKERPQLPEGETGAVIPMRQARGDRHWRQHQRA
jgi:hypothetical protein